MLKKIMTYSAVVAMLAVVLAPSVALALVQPTIPIGSGGPVVTTRTLEKLINDAVQFLLTVSVVIAVGVIVWGGIETMRGGWEKGKVILTRGVVGVAIVLGVGLILRTLARFINTGASLQ